MKNYSLSPSNKNIINSLVTDSVDRNKTLFQFINFLDLMNDCFTIAINGNWGSGKTFFVKQAKVILDFYNQQVKLPNSTKNSLAEFLQRQNDLKCSGNYISAYYDAWENDNEEDPILSIIKSIVTDDHIDFSPATERSFSEIIASLVNVLSGRDFNKLLEAMKGSNSFSEFKSKYTLSDSMKSFFDALIIERGNRLVIFVDELDRCKPTYAVKLLERIKHYFTDPRVTFVFSVNAQELQSTIKKYYGQDFNSGRYLDKFFDFKFTLPSVTNMLCDKYFARLELKSDVNYSNRICRQVITYFGLEMREAEKFARNFKIISSTENSLEPIAAYEKATNFSICCIAPILIALDIHDANTYDKFIHGKAPSTMVDILSSPSINFWRHPHLLSKNEVFDAQAPLQASSSQKVVHFATRIEEIYNALFSPQDMDPSHYRPVEIGEMEFSLQIRNNLLETVSMLSRFSSF
ncbi:KAP family P-loop NTPase fold protein [Allofournierella sp.]|uniref:KAP family P-loop NTPase fold protein n=1 Tax=Allofournierella sp. TaxID=1940256 RepID=UPI003AEF7131